jgi:polyferredoxin
MVPTPMTTPDPRQREVHPSNFLDSPRNLFRITTIRIVVQTVVFFLFLSFILLTTFARLDQYPGLRLWVGKVLEVDPLIALATAITTHTVYRGLLWSLIILVPTLFLGRFFCGWVCPYGALHHFVGWALGGFKKKQKIEANQYRPLYRAKYGILAALLVAALFGSLQIGLLDPICLLYRSFTGSVVPALSLTPAQSVLGGYSPNQGAWLIGALLFGFVAMNLVIPRFFCRVLCPLGALLGVLSRFSWWRIERDRHQCDHCDLCPTSCEGACDPHQDLRKSECFVCFNSLEDCPCGALTFRFMPPKEHEVPGTELPRRKLIFAAIAGVLFYPFNRASAKTTRDFSSEVIRPPGTVEELEFLERCIKCAQCIRVCPTKVLQPAWFGAGLEGLWTPEMNFRIGHCQLNCTACGQVCPTGAIQRISVDEKLGRGEFAKRGPIKLGTAHIDPGRCLPFSKNIPCVVCEEVCPTSPKAVCT